VLVLRTETFSASRRRVHIERLAFIYSCKYLYRIKFMPFPREYERPLGVYHVLMARDIQIISYRYLCKGWDGLEPI
jgi:hypothetical protein